MSVIEATSEASFNGSLGSHTCVFFWATWHEPSKPGGQMDQVIPLDFKSWSIPARVMVLSIKTRAGVSQTCRLLALLPYIVKGCHFFYVDHAQT